MTEIELENESGAMPTLRIVGGYDELSRLAADRVTEAIQRSPTAAITVPTGETPLGMYRELVRRVESGELDLRQTHVFCLDEYVGVSPEDEGSLTRFLKRSFTEPADLPADHLHLLPSQASDIDAAAARYEADISALGGLALAVLGLGQNGHVAFNEPGSEPDSQTRVVTLTPESRSQSADYWDGHHEIPPTAITIGIGTILAARQIVLIVSGESKADTLRRTLEGPMTSDLPASWLRLAADRLEVIADEAAAKWMVDSG
jgi:glucosamine-6-phosphate deaminase